MKFINELNENDRVNEIFFCKQKQLCKAKTGKNYLFLVLQDKTGVINAKIWDSDLNYEIEKFEQNDFVKIDGFVNFYNNELQIIISRLKKAEPEEYEIKNYVKTSNKDLDKLKNDLLEYISSVRNKFLSELLDKIFDEERLKIFCEHSAGKSMHHSFFGGLLEHTVSVVEICDFMCKRNKLIDRDILITCAILHDIGKIYELNDFPENNYSDAGELIGHIVIGSDLISKKICEINNFPDDLRLKILHCILSHHGEYEFGSPKLPKTIEALVLHFADNLDAKTKMFEELAENDKSDSNWTSYNKILERRLLKPNV